MGAFTSRNEAVEETEQSMHFVYKYPPRSGNYFSSHFIMGGERFDTPQPESYLFGENSDLNFLGNRPTGFPYPPPLANEPTKTLKCLVNIRKESVRFVRIATDRLFDKSAENSKKVAISPDKLDPKFGYTIEFTFDSDANCAITIFYVCVEEVRNNSIVLIPKDGLCSETYRFEKGTNQHFSRPDHCFYPDSLKEEDLLYNVNKEQYPVAIHCVIEEGNEEYRQSHTTICVIDHHVDSNCYILRAFKQKIFVDGLSYLLQEIYGIENKALKISTDGDDIEDQGSECVICMSETRDTLILPCRHLCLCNSCADSLRYQANNCPICRAPFRALLQIRAVQKGANALNNIPMLTTEQTQSDQVVPPGYVPISLVEALNGPLQSGKKLCMADDSRKDYKSKMQKKKTNKCSTNQVGISNEHVTEKSLQDLSGKSFIKTRKKDESLDGQPLYANSRRNNVTPEENDDSDGGNLSPLLTSRTKYCRSQLHNDNILLPADDRTEIDSTYKENDSIATLPEKQVESKQSPSILKDQFKDNIESTRNNPCDMLKDEMKVALNSFPDSLDSPIGGNVTSARSSDSYSSSSSTKQLLTSNTSTLANIILDENTQIQNAVNV